MVIRKHNFWMYLIIPTLLESNSWWELSALNMKSFLLSSSLTILNDSREKREKGKQSLVYGQITWDRVVQNILTVFVLTICPILTSRQVFLIHWQTIIFEMVAENFQHSEMLARHIKMSLFRLEHIIPAKFVGLKPLSIRIKRPLPCWNSTINRQLVCLYEIVGSRLRCCNLV